MGLVKGICYGNDAFPYPYNESNANSYQCTFGSDSTADYVAPLHGGQYMSPVKLWCQEAQGIPDPPPCRNDLNNIHSMGVEPIRLYDWDHRNRHEAFLEHCSVLGIGVLVSVSNYNLRPAQRLPGMNNAIPMLIKSFSKGNDYHPAVQGIVIGNEFNRAKDISVANVVFFTNAWALIEQQTFPGHRKVPIGHPVAFGRINNEYDC